ncbi:MAG: SIMPL domain-containing protein [Hyphomonadaceae bacterium]|nr:SIMPL domain-containing protein [Hyphomonadaceae bacterium]
MNTIKAAAAAAMLAAAAATPAAAQQHAGHEGHAAHAIEGAMLTISAEGRVESAPDMATISLGVMTEGQTAAAALAENSRRMTALTQALRRAGIAERDIQTTNVSVNPQYAYVENQPPRLTGYQANNQVSARVRNLDTVGRVIDAAVNAGGNTVNGISFSHADPDAQLDAARREAAQNARRRADLYAQAFGMRVHRVIAINEGGGYTPPIPMPYMARMEAAAPPPPIAPGEVTTSVNVNVTYELR